MSGTIDLTDQQQLNAFVTALKRAGLGGSSGGGSSPTPTPNSSFGNPSFGDFSKGAKDATKATGGFVKNVLEHLSDISAIFFTLI